MINYTPKTAGDSKDSPEKTPKAMILVKELTSKVFVPLHPEDSIVEAQKKLLKQKLPGSPVVDGDDHPVGFLSERDCLVRIVEMKYHNDMSVGVKDFMSQQCVTIEENENLMKAIEIFSANSFVLLPVVDSKNKVIGLLTRESVFKYVVGVKQQNW